LDENRAAAATLIGVQGSFREDCEIEGMAARRVVERRPIKKLTEEPEFYIMP